MEQREARNVAQCEMFPEVCSDGPYKGYKRLHWIHSAARKKPEERFHALMHHLNEDNFRRAFQRLKGSKACGIDQVTKSAYQRNLDSNLADLAGEIRRGGWRPKPSREVLIPKTNGGQRPIAIGCLEDKIVQTVTALILEALYEPLFYPISYGFRRGRSAKQALSRLYRTIHRRRKKCVVVEVDIEKFFDSIDHDWLLNKLGEKIGDPHFLRLIRRMLRNSILKTDGELKLSVSGTPQGSPVSPILANICLHYLLDEWFMANHSDEGEIIRYADDALFVFQDEQEARRFLHALTERVAEAGLRLNTDKSSMIPFSHEAPKGTTTFLGFELYWGRDRSRQPVLKVKTSAKRLHRCMQDFKEWIKRTRNRVRLKKLWEMAAAKLRGHFGYFGVCFNSRRLNHFYQVCIRALYKWLNRRSQKRSFTWERFRRRLWFHPLPKPPYERELLDITSDLDSGWKRKPRSRMRKLRTSGSVRSASQKLAFT